MLKNLINKITKRYKDYKSTIIQNYKDYKLTKVSTKIAAKIPECEIVSDPVDQNIQVHINDVDPYTMCAYVSKTPKVKLDENGMHYTFENVLGLTEIHIRNNKQTQDAFEEHLLKQRELASQKCRCANCKNR